MNIETRSIGRYLEILVKDGGATIETGPLSASELRQIADQLEAVLDDLKTSMEPNL